MKWNRVPALVRWCVVGGLLGIGFIVPALWLCVIVGAVLFIEMSITSSRFSVAVWGGLVAWSIKSLCAVWWFWYVFPFDSWLAVGGWWYEVLILGISWSVSGIALGSGGALLSGLLWLVYTRLRLPVWLIVFGLPLLWIMSEKAGSFIFSLVTSGPGSFLQSYFSFGYVGYLFGLSRFGILLASLGGVYGLTLVIIGVAAAIRFLPRRARFVVVGAFMVMVVILQYTPLGTVLQQTDAPLGITVAVIDTSFDAESVLAEGGLTLKANVLEQAVAAALTLQTDFILLPEDSRYLSLVYPRSTIKQSFATYQFSHSTSSSVIIDSGKTELLTGELVQRARLFSGTAGYLYEFDKQYLVPQGEFVPYVFRLMLKLSGSALAVLSQPSVGRYEPGPLKQEGTIDVQVPGILFCFESARPDGSMVLTTSRTTPRFIVHPISHAWFHTPNLLWVQLDVMLQIQARQASVPIVGSGNMVAGKTYLPSGEVIEESAVASGPRFQVRLVNL